MNSFYSEERFHSLINIERMRCDRSGRPFALLLFPIENALEKEREPLNVLSQLKRCFREIDCIGWYREGRIAGVLVSDFVAQEPDEAVKAIRLRVADRLESYCSSDLAKALEVRQIIPSSLL